MELRRSMICLVFFVLAVSQCSAARHSIHRREADEDVNYDDPQLADEAEEDETQNDTESDGGSEAQREPEIPATVLTQTSNYDITIGRDLRLECKVSPDSTVVQWYKNGQTYVLGNLRIIDDDRFSIVANSKDLLIKNVKPSDSGVYKCEVLQKHPVGVNHTVVVLESPRIIRFTATDEGRVVEGSDLLLTCDVAGSPPPQIVWSREADSGNKRLQEKDGEFSVNSVYIKDVKKDQAGKYYCYAFNRAGHNQAEVKVTVFSKPQVHVHKTIVNSAINVEAVLQCSAHEDPSPHIRWYKDGKLIEDSSSLFTVSTHGSHSNLTVTPSSDADFGTFTCEAENSHGKHNRSIDLVQSPVVEDFYVEGPKLSWTVHSHQPLEEIEVQLRNFNGEGDWRQLSVPLPEDKNHKYEIVYPLEENLLEPGKYEAIVRVKNLNSWSKTVEPAIVDIEAQPEYIQHASVYRGNDAHSIRPATTSVLSTILMYLLVRMV